MLHTAPAVAIVVRGTADLPEADGHRLLPGTICRPELPVNEGEHMSHEVNGSGAATEGTEGTAEKAQEFAGEATENVKEFAGEATENVKEFAGEATGKAKEFAGGVTENVKGLGARIAGLFKGGK
jgi:uncharacterized protein YjbJ (UPF0337 family)